MFTIRLQTKTYRPDLQVTVRDSVNGWDHDTAGIYQADEWRFELSENLFPGGINFKFVLERTYWMTGPNLFIQPAAGGNYVFSEAVVQFPPVSEAIVENSTFQGNFFKPNLDENHLYDVIVIGSGIGGGVAADQMADLGLDVLVLEAGSLLFQTHTANLPRRQAVGKFSKHLWDLFEDYKVVNYVNAAGSEFNGAQAFNLGGRSVFWGGLIPRMTWWELETWPDSIKWYLEGAGYQRAEDMIYWPSPPQQYQQDVKALLRSKWPDFDHFDAPVAVRNLNPAVGTIPAGLFSTADLLTESRLTAGAEGNQNLTINLNHAVVKLEENGNGIGKVVAYDLLVGQARSYKAKFVVLSAGTIESAKLVKQSGLKDPSGLAGVGITDHPIFFTHFSIPQGKPWHRTDASSKILSRHKQATGAAHPYNIVLELGADLNQGRYLDDDILAEHRRLKGNAMLCEIVFLFNAPLIAANRMDHVGPSSAKPVITMQQSPAANAFWGEVNDIKNGVVVELGGEALPGSNLDLNRAGLGGVAHEVGTLRLSLGPNGVVDENLKFRGYDNLYVCDLSVFPSSPAANPTLTLTALALRLADHIRTKV
jgi:choline dehydrogenase-like flavoprotein